VRTPDECFDGLPDYPWEPNYARSTGCGCTTSTPAIRDGEVVLLLHGQPDWSYLYRKMIPVLADAGFRVIAPDLIGFGKSDKPVQFADYRFLHHVAWVEEFIDVLGLDAITPVVQDWGSLIGLRCVGNRPDRFARVVVANGNLLVLPEGSRS
jgi:haloalkane dehalogenase